MELALILIFGALGGIARGLTGFVKYFSSYKNVKFSWRYMGITVGISAGVGITTAWAIKESGISFEGISLNPAIAFMFGYAGSDVLENMYKILTKTPILGPFNTILKAEDKKK